MTRSVDWTKAHEWPMDKLERELEADTDEIDEGAEATDEQLAQAVLCRRKPGQRGPGKKPAKVLMSLRVAPDTLAAWRATGPGWQAPMRELLRAFGYYDGTAQARVDAVLTEAAKKLKA